MARQHPISDSPWLWFGLFSAVGLVALLATGGKYGHRQASLEKKAQARLAVAQGMKTEVDASGRKTTPNVPQYSEPGRTKIPLTPLAMTLGAIFLICLALLVREQFMVKRSSQAEKMIL